VKTAYWWLGLGGVALLFMLPRRPQAVAPPPFDYGEGGGGGGAGAGNGGRPPDMEPPTPRDPDGVAPEELQTALNDFRLYVLDGLRMLSQAPFEPFAQLPRNGNCTAHGGGALVVDGIIGGCSENALTVAETVLHTAWVDPAVDVVEFVDLLNADAFVGLQAEDGSFIDVPADEVVEAIGQAAFLLHSEGYI
jgi:hypothetical protein